MRKSYFVILIVCLSFLVVSAASAEMYGAVKAGYVMTSDSDIGPVTLEYDSSFGIGFALGTYIEAFRLEGELEYRSADMDKISEGPNSASLDGDLTTWSLMANGYYDIETGSGIKPFIGAGIGFAKHTAEINSVSGAPAEVEEEFVGEEDDTVFAYQFTVGAAMAMSDAIDLDFAYRYFATADADFGGEDVDYGSHNITVGVRFKF